MAENKRETSDGAAANDEQRLVKPNSIVWDKVATAIRKYMPDGQDDWDMLCDIEDAVAAALAARAREEAQFWAEEGGHVADGSSECIYCARLAERAAGEKGQ